MNDFVRINTPRVEKIVAMLQTIHKSARSNRVGQRDVLQMLAPMREAERAMGDLHETARSLPPGVVPAEPETPPVRPQTPTTSHWSDVIEMARNAPLSEAVTAMQIIATRVEQELFERDM